MNASWMLSLYPRAWRDRYEEEFRAMLEGHSAGPSEMLDILYGALDAHLRPQLQQHGSKGEVRTPEPIRSRSPRLQAFFYAHAAFFLIINALLIVINVLFSAGNWWFPYSLWGTGLALVAHAGLTFPWRHYFGMHLGLYALLNVGLIAINVDQGGQPWSVWPTVTLGVLLVTHGLLAFRLVSLFQAHVIANILASIELLLLPLFVDVAVLEMLTTAATLWVIVFVHWLVRYQRVSLFTAHIALFTGMMSLLAVDNAFDDSGIWWVRYPLVVWGMILGAHALAQTSRATMSASAAWETTMLQVLGNRSRETPRQRRLRTLMFHFGLFALGSAILIVLDLMDAPGTWWAMWPVGVWLGLLALHLGWVILPRRLLGFHLVAWLVTSGGLVAIDLATEGGPWWHWPIVWWGVIVAIHAGSFLPVRTPFLGMHLAGALTLSGALVFTNTETGSPTWWWYPVAALIFSVVMHAGWMLERSMGRNR